MIPLSKRISELTWGEVIADLDERYGKFQLLGENQPGALAEEFISIKQCSSLTGYTPGYIRQLIFRHAIPFYKNPKLKPIRFKRSEIIAWMASKKFTPITEQAENYIEENNSIKNKSKRA